MPKLRMRGIVFTIGLILIGVGSLLSISDFLSFDIVESNTPQKQLTERVINIDIKGNTFISRFAEVIVND